MQINIFGQKKLWYLIKIILDNNFYIKNQSQYLNYFRQKYFAFNI